MLSRHKFHTLVATLATSLLGCAGSPVLTPIFTAVTAKGFHTWGVEAGAAYCWGGNFFGELGDGTTTNRSTPTLVLGGVSFVAVSAGSFHTCGVTPAGAAYCWGRNSFGELGDGTTINQLTPVPVLAGGRFFTAVSAGYSYTCGLTAAGDVYCWGHNNSGQLGDGTTTDRLTPVLVLSVVNFVAVSARAGHTCRLTAAGAPHCCGPNDSGHLGAATTTTTATPAPGQSLRVPAAVER